MYIVTLSFDCFSGRAGNNAVFTDDAVGAVGSSEDTVGAVGSSEDTGDRRRTMVIIGGRW